MFNTAYRSESTEYLKTIAVDAKQRFVFIKTDKTGKQSVVCPEPSPDALSAGSINLSVDANKEQLAELKAALSSAEQASSIGLRTQSISLLRDQLAYMCLLRMADSRDQLNPDQYLLLFKRYQSAVLGVLAIEQLTGAIKAPPATVSVSGNATVTVDAAKKPTAAALGPSGTPDAAEPAASSAPSAAGAASAGSSSTKPAKTTVRTVRSATASTAADVGVGVGVGSPVRTSEVAADSSRPVVSRDGSNSDVAVVAQTVYNIVDLIVTKSFQFENCYVSNVNSGTENVIPVSKNEACAAQTQLEDCLKSNSQNTCYEGARRSFQSSLLSRGADPATAYADASVIAAQRFSVPVPEGIPLKSMNVGVFKCSGTSEAYLNSLIDKLIGKLVANGAPRGRIHVRGEFTKEILRGKGFDPAKRAQVLFDNDSKSEVDASQKLQGFAQQVLDELAPGQTASRDANRTASTPLYLSVMFCDQ